MHKYRNMYIVVKSRKMRFKRLYVFYGIVIA
nr:MAG TPA: hypothetical protein [Caudoviricetes sp.]